MSVASSVMNCWNCVSGSTVPPELLLVSRLLVKLIEVRGSRYSATAP